MRILLYIDTSEMEETVSVLNEHVGSEIMLYNPYVTREIVVPFKLTADSNVTFVFVDTDNEVWDIFGKFHKQFRGISIILDEGTFNGLRLELFPDYRDRARYASEIELRDPSHVPIVISSAPAKFLFEKSKQSIFTKKSFEVCLRINTLRPELSVNFYSKLGFVLSDDDPDLGLQLVNSDMPDFSIVLTKGEFIFIRRDLEDVWIEITIYDGELFSQLFHRFGKKEDELEKDVKGRRLFGTAIGNVGFQFTEVV